MRRREFIGLVAAAAAWPAAARAQPSGAVIGFMHGSNARLNQDAVAAFREGLAQTGYVEGQNVAIEYRWAEGEYSRLPGLAVELIRLPVTLIAANTPVAALAAKQATTSVPIVFAIGSDPVKDGLVTNLSRPEGNVTGATFFSNLLTGKRLELLHEIVPNAKLYSALVNPTNANAQLQMSEAREAGRTLGLQLGFTAAETTSDIDEAFVGFVREGVQALLVLSDAFLNGRAGRIAELALQHALPTCFAYREPVTAGGLMSYGSSRTEAYRQAGNYAGRILKGAKPSELPVQQPTKFEFVLNKATANVLGLEIPPTLLALADQVIE